MFVLSNQHFVTHFKLRTLNSTTEELSKHVFKSVVHFLKFIVCFFSRRKLGLPVIEFKSNQQGQWLDFSSHCDWSRKPRPPPQPIRYNTKINREVTPIFTLSFEFQLASHGNSPFLSLEVLSFVWFDNFQSKGALHEVKLDWVSNLEIFYANSINFLCADASLTL